MSGAEYRGASQSLQQPFRPRGAAPRERRCAPRISRAEKAL